MNKPTFVVLLSTIEASLTRAFSRVETDSNIMQVRPRLMLPFTLKEETRVHKTNEPMSKPDFALQTEIFKDLAMLCI